MQAAIACPVSQTAPSGCMARPYATLCAPTANSPGLCKHMNQSAIGHSIAGAIMPVPSKQGCCASFQPRAAVRGACTHLQDGTAKPGNFQIDHSKGDCQQPTHHTDDDGRCHCSHMVCQLGLHLQPQHTCWQRPSSLEQGRAVINRVERPCSSCTSHVQARSNR